MADTGARPHMRLTLREFLEWEERQPRKYELLDGLVKMMPGGTQRHNTIAGNIYVALREKLRGKPCRPHNSGAKFVAPEGQSFYPDVTVDCGPYDADATASGLPTIVFEVLSPSTRNDDLKIKLPAYQATASLKQIVFVEPERVHVMLWTRNADGAWEEDQRVHPDSAFPLAGLDAELPLSVIYEDAG